ncbi:MAG: hypothetical protein K0R54_635 [Clostridiaceae bacterium]|jgi:hypothetical protein|nr:hypothetical protein [Clostridiaceae bacterium]
MNNERVEFKGYYLVRSEDLKEVITFDSSLEALGEAVNNYPCIIDNDLLIYLYYSIIYKSYDNDLTANFIVGWMEAEITGRGTAIPISNMFDLIEDCYEWIDLDINTQKEIISKNIREKLAN